MPSTISRRCVLQAGASALAGTLALIQVGLLIALWPNVPWLALEIGAPVMMIIAPFIFYPFSQTTWLAFDLLLHPLTEEELDWHRTSEEGAMRKSDYR